MTDLSVETLAYAAGLFDGRGSVLITFTPSGGGRKYPTYGLLVKISNTNQEVIEWLYATFGGRIHEYAHTPSRKRLQILWEWIIGSNQAAKLLQSILPYLRIKKEQAEIAIAFQEYMNAHSYTRTVSEEDLEVREDYRNKIRDLNKKVTGSLVEK